jgi:hypothetical protein
MSRTDDYGLQDPNREPHERSQRTFDHTAEIASRAGLTREAAKHEMEKFLGVAEYETRKLVGQHSTLRQPSPPAPVEANRQRQAEARTQEREAERQEAAAETPTMEQTAEIAAPTQEMPATTEG